MGLLYKAISTYLYFVQATLKNRALPKLRKKQQQSIFNKISQILSSVQDGSSL